ncbi:transcriptional regulator [Marivirga tractuosa]|uniref:Transcriptional repressor, CopY family n=1 Tax=Marivirga tractuosa (strain ATCC 23168 / DSM 4126 / NBRC 15989 / NCIMB 1408 / VKM B-1430 / H-43) TaxID=643867 RepID=E4TNJ2_MARTH|nr:BlaI/MecI/CopY family transcriptional regulator [Marivirga tractuosa]ADR20449.1 transcriptional repressor, CopY family [Marivirga tractuosa DSM 4126]BDD15106.1 transcriptional regulator [Marivirga tractuosa]
MKELTKAEEQLMRHLWKLEKAYLKDIVDEYDEPKPAYTTISTVVNVLVRKGIIGFDLHGKAKHYYPLISKEDYSNQSIKGLVSNFFNNSYQQFASFFTSRKELSVDELKEIRKMIDDEIKKKGK